MDFFGYGIPLGRYFGINVRLHFTFLLYAFARVSQFGNVAFGFAYIVGLYLCILLHEFGHALAARWCDGEANDILLWPLGGLAFVRPAFNPTAHLITTVAGPFVTLVLWGVFAGLAALMGQVWGPIYVLSHEQRMVLYYISAMASLNKYLLIFNLIPAFPMDGGRILRDTLWHWLSAETATAIAINVSRVMAVLGAAYAIYEQDYWLLVFPVFIFMQCLNEQHIVAMEARGVYQFSIKERLKRGQRQLAFRQAVKEVTGAESAAAFHHCATCGLTEIESPTMDFRVCEECTTGNEYCREHLNAHKHV